MTEDPAAQDSASRQADVPPTVPDYELTRLIGEGGFGRVWMARNRATGHLRAVKVIPLHGPSSVSPAGREITSITRLEANMRRQHSNLLNIHHVGMTDEFLFYVMDLADDVSGDRVSSDSGQAEYRPATLQSRLADGPLPPEECDRYARQLLDGLASLHEAGMVHRDVKPANCLFVDGELKLADFGLVTEANPQVSRVGTLKYMPPDGRMDARADVYAAGLVIYEMITGLPAESFPRPGDAVEAAIDSPVLGTLNRLVLRACEREPQERFRDAKRMLAELRQSESRATDSRRASRRLLLASAACVVVGGAAATAFWLSQPRTVYVNFISDPYEATIYLDDQLQLDDQGNPYKTPCTIENLPARTYRVVFKHADQPNDLDLGAKDLAEERRIEASWME